jgi:hypothetical protein
MSTKIMKHVKDLMPDWQGQASLYKCSDGPLPEYVVVSAVITYSGPETFIFEADSEGVVKSYLELPGSQWGTLSHDKVIRDLGYYFEY